MVGNHSCPPSEHWVPRDGHYITTISYHFDTKTACIGVCFFDCLWLCLWAVDSPIWISIPFLSYLGQVCSFRKRGLCLNVSFGVGVAETRGNTKYKTHHREENRNKPIHTTIAGASTGAGAGAGTHDTFHTVRIRATRLKRHWALGRRTMTITPFRATHPTTAAAQPSPIVIITWEGSAVFAEAHTSAPSIRV